MVLYFEKIGSLSIKAQCDFSFRGIVNLINSNNNNKMRVFANILLVAILGIVAFILFLPQEIRLEINPIAWSALRKPRFGAIYFYHTKPERIGFLAGR